MRLEMVNIGVPGCLVGPRVSEVGAVDGGGWTGFAEEDPRNEGIRRLPAGVIQRSNKRLESLFMELDSFLPQDGNPGRVQCRRQSQVQVNLQGNKYKITKVQGKVKANVMWLELYH
ncbi:hypothetical protein ILYODFUR_008360 [Ilyodon furcidens]|uniref:Uncharacterized protein n=1 Tax=Ilyodon furcidens TaxID=33524 RepID=A0ABV0V1D1_9TELE